MRLTLDEIRVAASAIRALPPASPVHGSSTYVGWRTMGGTGFLDNEGNTIPCRCAAQAVFEFRHNLPERAYPGDLGAAASQCYSDLHVLLQAMGHSGGLVFYGGIKSALPYLEQIISAAEYKPVPLPRITAPEAFAARMEESLMV